MVTYVKNSSFFTHRRSDRPTGKEQNNSPKITCNPLRFVREGREHSRLYAHRNMRKVCWEEKKVILDKIFFICYDD